jgi:hypothetical protein
MKEANITIAGHDLTFQESIAMNHFLSYLTNKGLGDDDNGKRITANYRLHTREILHFIHEEAQ